MSAGHAEEYGPSSIEVLEGVEAVRRRPGMYVGSTGERGLYHLVCEATHRSVSEVLAGRATTVDVTLTADGRVRVRDDGPGVPFEAAGHPGRPGLEALLTSTTARERPDDRHTVDLTRLGIGLIVVNALSSRLTAEVRRDGVHWAQEYARGVALAPPAPVGPATGTGTTLTFRPDPGVFPTARCSRDALADRFRELAFLNRPLALSLADERPRDADGYDGAVPGGTWHERFDFPGGLRDYVAHLDAREGTPVRHPDVVHFEAEAPRMAGTVEVGLRWNDSREERVLGFANSRATPEGGTHLTGLREGIAAAVGAYARGRRLPAATDRAPGGTWTGAGLTAVVSVKLDRPEFQGATRSRLGGAVVHECVAELVRERLGAWLEEHPEQAAAVVVGRS
ncbi:ATP-binding protein [Streptomyces sp. NPDC091281]|uniref:ATP-binding protein n=1 Tax=Streptomyces sp. NPDC091281 TaxID=3365985 RepID=UPI00382D6AE3